MITTTIGDVINDTVKGDEGAAFKVYVVRDGETVFYVGKSRNNPVERLWQHLALIGPNHGPSELGQLIKDNAPDSHAWQVELRTVADCEPFIRQEFPVHRLFDSDLAERAMIRTLHPCLNGTHNAHPTRLPERYRRQQQNLTDAPCDRIGLKLN